MHEIKHKPITEDTINEGFEHADMRISLIAMVFIGIGVVSVIACMIIIGLMYLVNEHHEPLAGAERSPVYTSQRMVSGYEGPLVETTPREDRDAYLKAIKHKRDTYGIVSEDPNMKRARIPVEEAMKMLAAGQIPYKREPQQALVQ